MTITLSPQEQQVARLGRLRNRTTRRELAAINRGSQDPALPREQDVAPRNPDLTRSARRRTRQADRQHGVRRATRASDGCRMGDRSSRFTGRTQRDAMMHHELPYIEDL